MILLANPHAFGLVKDVESVRDLWVVLKVGSDTTVHASEILYKKVPSLCL